MQHRTTRASTRRLLVRALALFAMLVADAALAQHYVVGDEVEPFSLEDQHGKTHAVDASVKAILFSRDMEGGDFLKIGLADVEPGYLEARGAVYVADISAMPRLVARMFAIPAMRDRPYPMLLDRDGEATARLPGEKGRATILSLDQLVVERIEHVAEVPAVRRVLESSGGE
jgi:hypothetical protein